METTCQDGRKLWTYKHNVEYQPMTSIHKQSKSFTSTCAAEKKGMLDEETCAAHLEQSVQQQKSALNELPDQQSSFEVVGPKEVTETKCSPCKGSKCQTDDNTGGKMFQILIEIKYNIRTGKEHVITLELECNRHQYMIWKYIMNSPRQCDKCNYHFNSTEENITLLLNSSVTINSPVNNKEHAVKITEKVFDYAVNILGKVLTVETIEIKKKNIEKEAEKLNERFGREIACASAIEDQVCIVFPESGRECVKKLLLEYMKDTDLVTQSVCLQKVLHKFPCMIENCFRARNTNISYKLAEAENQLVCTINGHETDVNEAVRKLRSVEENMKQLDLKFSQRKEDGLKHLCVEDIINEHLKTSFPDCVFEQTDAHLRLYGFEVNVLQGAASYVGELIMELETEIQEKLMENKGELVEHLQSKYEDNILVDVDGKFGLYMVGLKEAVEKACAESIDIQESIKSLNAAANQSKVHLQTKGIYEVRNAKHLKYFEKSVFIEKIADTFKVNVTCIRESYTVEISGFEKDVRKAIEFLHKIGHTTVFDCVVIVQNTAVTFFESDSGQAYIDKIERESDVYLEKQSIQTFSNDKMKVSKTKNNGYNLWSLSEDRSLTLEQLSVEQVIACVKIIPSTHSLKTGSTIVKGQHMVDMGLPDWIDDKHLEREELTEVLSQIFNDVDKTKETSVAISLKPTAKWTFEPLMKCIVEFAVKWLLVSQNEKPSAVKLCASEGTFISTDEYIDKRVEASIEVFICVWQITRNHLTIIKQVDVLVNTAASNLDLTKGKVSVALLNRAGIGLQQECSKNYPKGITYGDIAVTNGYDTGCKRVFHMTLLPYYQNCIVYLRQAMMLCLKTASDYRYKSIAFPVMGTGSLGYPVELVAAEMFGCVERFKQNCFTTTLKEVLFVIYHRDVELLQYFKKVEREVYTANISTSKTVQSHQIKIEVIGEKENVNQAKRNLEAKISDILKDEDADATAHITRRSSPAHAIPKQIRDDSMDRVNRSSVDIDNNLKDTDISKYPQSDTERKQAPFDISLYLDRSLAARVGSSSKTAPKNTARDRLKYPLPKQETSLKEISQSGIHASYILERKKLKCYFSSNCVMEIYDGDIMRICDVDAIVCSENRDGDARGKIANLLLQEGGQNYRHMKGVKFSGSRKFGEVITIPGERCRFKWIMHAVVSKKDHRGIPAIYKNIFTEAKKRNITSLALPIMGTGAGGMDPISSSEILFSEWIQFCNGSRNCPLTLHVVINDSPVASLIKDVFKTRIDDMNQSRSKTDTASASHLGAVTPTKVAEEKDEDKTVSATKNQPATEDDCVICMDKVNDPKKLRCGHTFCTECIEGYFRVKKVCPTCGKVCGIITGDQPKGTMEIAKRHSYVAGYERYKSISITYRFQQGKQGPDHPSPGVPFKPIDRTAYLPDNKEGREICAMLKLAFERRLVFTIGTSRTTGQEGVITWNDIHHKTDIRQNTQFGYPDNTYLQRVREELEVKGVTMEDVDRKFIRQLDKDNFRYSIN